MAIVKLVEKDEEYFTIGDLIEDIKYQDREPVKYDWERYMGKLNAAVVIADN